MRLINIDHPLIGKISKKLQYQLIIPKFMVLCSRADFATASQVTATESF